MSHESEAVPFLITGVDTPQTVVGPGDLVVPAPAADMSYGITYTAPGLWTLQPGYTYTLGARLTAASGVINEDTIFWVNSANALIGSVNLGNSRVAAQGEGYVRAAIKPVAPVTVKLRSPVSTETIRTVEIVIRTVSQ